MAAYAALVSLMNLIHDLEHHPSPPISLDKQLLDSIAQRITYFQKSLQSYNIPPHEEFADPLEMRIADAAYSAEDAIESHIVDCIERRPSKNENDEKIKSVNLCHDCLQSVIEEMDSIKKAVVAEKLEKAPVVHDQVSLTNVPAASVVAPSEPLMESDGVVLEIMEKLAGGQLDFQVIPIVGMGGIGKTFLAKSVYAKPFIKERFDICAWATISQHYDTREILCELLSQATDTKKSVDKLGLELRQHLFSRRFLIVMDDMWNIDSWDEIQRFFPNNGNGSRVLVTTRLSQLSSQLNNDYSLSMSFLDKASSWDLFSKTVFGEKISCPPELEYIGEKIVDKCRGLPLSIAVVGGLLKKMDATRASWESIQGNFTSMVNMNNDKHCLRLLKLSYDHLPVYLKPCFLYMGVFEEDENIRVSTLLQLWVSEGFLKPTNGEALETTASVFLQDLIDRNLILTGELGSTGSLRFCKMHDLVRDVCMKECEKEGFYHVMGQSNPPSPRRRIVIPKYTSKMKPIGDLRSMSHTRSIICQLGKVSLFRNLVLLRTLEVRKSMVSPLFCHVNLRHIAIMTHMTRPFLPFVKNLWNLRTLIVSYSFLGKPTCFAVFWKMQQLRHVGFTNSCACLPDPPNCDGDIEAIMENLHTLKGIRNFKCSEAVVRRLPNIKRLKLEYNGYDEDDADDDVDDDVYFVGNLKHLCGLEFLSIEFLVVGPITIVDKITFPHSLKKLSLDLNFKYEYDGMLQKISSLPLLENLKLSYGCFGKGMWEIDEGHFPCLKYLMLFRCQGLENWTASEEDASILPRLEHLKLGDLEELKTIPCELGNIDTLKSIKLNNCGEGAVKSAKEMFDEQVELQGGEDQLSFHVEVTVGAEQQHLQGLAGPKFYVNL